MAFSLFSSVIGNAHDFEVAYNSLDRPFGFTGRGISTYTPPAVTGPRAYWRDMAARAAKQGSWLTKVGVKFKPAVQAATNFTRALSTQPENRHVFATFTGGYGARASAGSRHHARGGYGDMTTAAGQELLHRLVQARASDPNIPSGQPLPPIVAPPPGPGDAPYASVISLLEGMSTAISVGSWGAELVQRARDVYTTLHTNGHLFEPYQLDRIDEKIKELEGLFVTQTDQVAGESDAEKRVIATLTTYFTRTLAVVENRLRLAKNTPQQRKYGEPGQSGRGPIEVDREHRIEYQDPAAAGPGGNQNGNNGGPGGGPPADDDDDQGGPPPRGERRANNRTERRVDSSDQFARVEHQGNGDIFHSRDGDVAGLRTDIDSEDGRHTPQRRLESAEERQMAEVEAEKARLEAKSHNELKRLAAAAGIHNSGRKAKETLVSQLVAKFQRDQLGIRSAQRGSGRPSGGAKRSKHTGRYVTLRR